VPPWASVPPCGSDRAPSGKSSLCLPLEHDQPLLAIRTQSQRAKPGQQPRRISDRRTLRESVADGSEDNGLGRGRLRRRPRKYKVSSRASSSVFAKRTGS
jgi:hypothetical protein